MIWTLDGDKRIDTGAGMLFQQQLGDPERRVLSKLGELPWNLSSRELNQCDPGELQSLKEEAADFKERFYLKIKLTVARIGHFTPTAVLRV